MCLYKNVVELNNRINCIKQEGFFVRIFEGFQKGINLGGWLSQGPLDKEHLDTFITKEDIARISSFGVDHVRLPLDYENIEYEDGSDKDSGYGYIDSCISWCKEYGLNIILDLHKTAGYIFDDAQNCEAFFTDKGLQDRFINTWIKLSKRYGSYSDMIAFELLNEVVDPEVAEIWNDIADRAIATIREYAPDTWLLLGGTRNNSIISLKELRRPKDDKIVFNFHCYEPLIFTHQAAYWIDEMPKDYSITYPLPLGDYVAATKTVLTPAHVDLIDGFDQTLTGKDFFIRYFKEATDVAERYNVPVYCGEYGVIDNVALTETLNWFKDIHAAFEETGIARCVWTYKKKDFGITDEHYADILDKLVKCL